LPAGWYVLVIVLPVSTAKPMLDSFLLAMHAATYILYTNLLGWTSENLGQSYDPAVYSTDTHLLFFSDTVRDLIVP
jgi:hypothetical protein